MDAITKSRHRVLRSRIGWGLAALWLIYRWISLDAARNAAIQALGDCNGFFAKAGCDTLAAGYHAGFTLGILGSLILAPLAFVVAHFIARALAEKQVAEHQRSQDLAMIAQLKHEDEQLRAKAEQAQQGAQRARSATSRTEFLNSLGSVNDYLDLLASAESTDLQLRIKQGVGKELRDLVAKHTLADLGQLVRNDETVQLALVATLDRLTPLAIAVDVVPVLRRTVTSVNAVDIGAIPQT